MAELADAHDSKSCGKPCGFESHLGHHTKKAEELEEIKNKEEKETITKIVYTWGKGEEKFRKGTYDFYVNTTNLENFSIRVIFQVDESGNIELESVNI